MMILDLNGDGKMEIAVKHSGVAGATTILELNENALNSVLKYDSGD